MLTQADIDRLLKQPKKIVKKTPRAGYDADNGHRRCELELESEQVPADIFTVFVRQNSTFIENFSIGPRYDLDDRPLGRVTLVRYNGPHGETTRASDGHYDKPHIHRVTAAELASGSIQPRERKREITDRYRTYEEALLRFFDDLSVSNPDDFFPNLRQPQLFS